jgi:hypothetical protein
MNSSRFYDDDGIEEFFFISSVIPFLPNTFEIIKKWLKFGYVFTSNSLSILLGAEKALNDLHCFHHE